MNTPRAHTLRLLLGDQLNPQHSWFATRDDGVVYVLMEVYRSICIQLCKETLY